MTPKCSNGAINYGSVVRKQYWKLSSFTRALHGKVIMEREEMRLLEIENLESRPTRHDSNVKTRRHFFIMLLTQSISERCQQNGANNRIKCWWRSFVGGNMWMRISSDFLQLLVVVATTFFILTFYFFPTTFLSLKANNWIVCSRQCTLEFNFLSSTDLLDHGSGALPASVNSVGNGNLPSPHQLTWRISARLLEIWLVYSHTA